jgi:heme O synthase-like polyprenyltransferase
MPRPDPVPSPRPSTFRNYLRLLKWLALFSVVIAVIAVLLVARGSDGVHIHMLIATALGVSLMVLLGTGLMALTFLSSSSGHDEQASRHDDDLDPKGDE